MSWIDALAKVGGEILTNEKVMAEISVGVTKGIRKLNNLFDMDGDGDVDQDDLNLMREYADMLVSIWGQAAMADGVTAECEEEAVYDLIEDIFFGANEPLFDKALLEDFGIKKKELKKSLWEKFESPETLKKIAKYAEDNELEDIFYKQACAVIFCDNEVNSEERQFLDAFAQMLDLLKFDKRRLENEYRKEIESRSSEST